jgi:hypothetical protein
MPAPVGEVDLDAAIRDARKRLDSFDRGATAGELLTRLRASSPLHPFLIVRSLSLLTTVFVLILALAALIVPFVSEDAAEIIARLDSASGIPLFLVLAVLVVCFFGVALGAHYAALAAARAAALLPHEAKVHQRLVSDLQQLEAQRAVSSRLTPLSAEPRTRRR